MKLIIPMAGYGSRLRPHTYTKPKPLLEVAGKPILQHILDGLSSLKFSEVIFITGPMKEQIEEFVSENYPFKSRFIPQQVMNGNASAVYLAKEFVNEDVLILYADTLFDIDFKEFRKLILDEKTDGLIWVKEVEDYKRFGVVVTSPDGVVTSMVEKPSTPVSRLANIGMYYVKDSAAMFKAIEILFEKKTMIRNEYYFSDALSMMVKSGKRFKAPAVKQWLDCGTFKTLLETNKILLKKSHSMKSRAKNSVIIPPVSIGKDVLIENCVIGPNVSIANGAVIKDSIVVNSIIDADAHLGAVTIRDSTIGYESVMKGTFKKINLGASSQLHENCDDEENP